MVALCRPSGILTDLKCMPVLTLFSLCYHMGKKNILCSEMKLLQLEYSESMLMHTYNKHAHVSVLTKIKEILGGSY